MSSQKHEVPEALLRFLLSNDQKPEDLIGDNGLLKWLEKALFGSKRCAWPLALA